MYFYIFVQLVDLLHLETECQFEMEIYELLTSADPCSQCNHKVSGYYSQCPREHGIVYMRLSHDSEPTLREQLCLHCNKVNISYSVETHAKFMGDPPAVFLVDHSKTSIVKERFDAKYGDNCVDYVARAVIIFQCLKQDSHQFFDDAFLPHYTALVRNPTNDGWYHCDDSMITESPLDLSSCIGDAKVKATDAFNESKSKLKTKKATTMYFEVELVLYERVNENESVENESKILVHTKEASKTVPLLRHQLKNINDRIDDISKDATFSYFECVCRNEQPETNRPYRLVHGNVKLKLLDCIHHEAWKQLSPAVYSGFCNTEKKNFATSSSLERLEAPLAPFRNAHVEHDNINCEGLLELEKVSRKYKLIPESVCLKFLHESEGLSGQLVRSKKNEMLFSSALFCQTCFDEERDLNSGVVSLDEEWMT